MADRQIGRSAALVGERGRQSFRPLPVGAVVIWLVVVIPSLLQVPFPGLYRALRRDPTQIRADGQWWRLAGQLLFACLATFAWPEAGPATQRPPSASPLR